jgi:hypothetical protein
MLAVIAAKGTAGCSLSAAGWLLVARINASPSWKLDSLGYLYPYG